MRINQEESFFNKEPGQVLTDMWNWGLGGESNLPCILHWFAKGLIMRPLAFKASKERLIKMGA